MYLLPVEDTASIETVLKTLEAQAKDLGPTSRVAGVWRDWADLLRPTCIEAQQEPD